MAGKTSAVYMKGVISMDLLTYLAFVSVFILFAVITFNNVYLRSENDALTRVVEALGNLTINLLDKLSKETPENKKPGRPKKVKSSKKVEK